MSKPAANPYQTIAGSVATWCQHHIGWAMSERYPRSGYSEFARAEKPFVINPRSRAVMVRPIRVPDWLVSLGSGYPGSEKRAIQFGSTAYQAAMGGHARSTKYTATRVLVGSWMKEPGLPGEAALIRISPAFRLTRKGQSIMIRRQE